MEQHETPSTPQYTPPPQQTSGRAIASMVLGICAIVTCSAYGVPGLICGILAVVFAKKAEDGIADGSAPESSRGMLKAGRICGWIGIALSALFFLIVVGMLLLGIVGAAAGAANNPTLLPF